MIKTATEIKRERLVSLSKGLRINLGMSFEELEENIEFALGQGTTHLTHEFEQPFEEFLRILVSYLDDRGYKTTMQRGSVKMWKVIVRLY